VRTLTAQQAACLASGDYAVHTRVFVDKDGASTMTDLTNVEGRSWLAGVHIKDDVDANGADAKITLLREEYQVSLATLMQASKLNQQPLGNYVPFITTNRAVRVEMAIVPIDTTPGASDWFNVFEGKIDEDDIGGDEPVITLTCRDKSGDLVDAWIENVTVYGSGAGTAMETVIQNILTDWGGGVSLYCPVSPSFNILSYAQQKEPVMDAVRKIAQQIGWDVKYRWHSGTSSWRLTLFDPGRSKTTPDLTLQASQYALSLLKVSKAFIRNAIRVVFTDAATKARTTVVRTDASSITKYGRRFMEVAEDAASQIDTTAEANAFGDAMLADLKDPNADAAAETMAIPLVETGDLHRLKANGRHFDVDQDLAVVGWELRADQKKVASTFRLRGKPSGGFRRWLRLDARAGVGSGTDTSGPGAPANGAATSVVGGIEVTYDMPTDLDWSHSEVHVSTSNGFTPSDSTKVAETKTNRFTIGGLIPGTTYYVKIIAVDRFGNKSTASTQVVTAAALVGPNAENQQRDNLNACPNPEFTIWTAPNTQATKPPDGWDVIYHATSTSAPVVDNTQWGTKAVADTSLHASGNASVKLGTFGGVGTGSLGLQLRDDALIPVKEGEIYRIAATIRSEGAGAIVDGEHIRVQVIYYQADKSTVVSTDTLAQYQSLTSFTDSVAWSKAPTNARWARIRIYYPGGANSATKYVNVDRMGFFKDFPDFRAVSATNNQSINNTTWTKASLDTGGTGCYDHGDTFDDGVDERFEAPLDGSYRFQASIAIENLLNGQSCQCALYVNGSVAAVGALSRSVGGLATPCQVAADLTLVKNDYVEVYVWHNHGSARDKTDVASETYFVGRRNR
jgi:hypothetical protein